VRLSRCEVGDHINYRKNDRWRSYRFYRALQWLKSPMRYLCEIFGAPRFSSFATQSATSGRSYQTHITLWRTWLQQNRDHRSTLRKHHPGRQAPSCRERPTRRFRQHVTAVSGAPVHPSARPWRSVGCLGARLREVLSSLREAQRLMVVHNLVRIYLQKMKHSANSGALFSWF
jgi:hypothetical protein